MNTIMRKGLLSVVGLAVAGGVAAGPATGALAADTKPADTKPAVAAAVQGQQSHLDLNDEQKANAKAIVAATKKAGMNERAAVIAVATAMQESKLDNLGHLGEVNDHDSQGLFQQRPSSGWGTEQQITDPQYSTTAFLKGLKGVDGWEKMPLTDAAQAVQVSAYPDHYAQWETQATQIVAEHWKS